MTIEQKILQAHSKPDFLNLYKATHVRKEIVCYPHALGLLQFERVGAISNNKPLNEKYTSKEEIKKLLFLDCKELQLGIEECSLEDEISDEQHKIILFVKTWANGVIADYHFWRYDNDLLWTEKWRGQGMRIIENFDLEISRFKSEFSLWSLEGIYKITKQRVQ